MKLDHADYRAAVLSGRSQAIEELADLVTRLARRFEPEHAPDITMGTLVHSWIEIVAWLSQAEAELEVERLLIESAPTVFDRKSPTLPKA